MWFPNRSDTKRAEQAQKKARGFKFWIWEEEELYFPCSENKGADQLRSDCEADLLFCFRICKMLVFSYRDSISNHNEYVCRYIISKYTLYAYVYTVGVADGLEKLKGENYVMGI